MQRSVRAPWRGTAAILACLLGGCAANKPIAVISTPPSAEVLVDGRAFGKTPITLTTNDIMPQRVTDGRPSTQAVLKLSKPGYEEYTVILREFSLPDKIHAQLKAVGLAEHFQNYLEQNPALVDATVASAAPPVIRVSEDLDTDSVQLYRAGHLLVGYSGFSSEGLALDSVKTQARDLGAAVALVQSKFAGVQTQLRAVTSHTSGGVASSFATGTATTSQRGHADVRDSLGQPAARVDFVGTNQTRVSASGFTILPSQSRTEFVPFSQRQFDNQITYWRKRKANALGAFCDFIPEPLRIELQRNTGAFVVGLVEGGPAFLANILPGDVIIGWNGKAVNTPSDLDLMPEATVTPAELEILRAGQHKKVSIAVPGQ